MLVLPKLISYNSIERDDGNTYLQIGLHHFGLSNFDAESFFYEKCGMRQPRLAQPYVHSSAERSPLRGLLHSFIHKDPTRHIEPGAIIIS